MAAVTTANISYFGYLINPSLQGSHTDTCHFRYFLNGNFVIVSDDLDDFSLECRLSATLSATLVDIRLTVLDCLLTEHNDNRRG